MTAYNNACTCGGDPDYHTVCNLNYAKQRDDYRKAKAALIAAIDANGHIGAELRKLLLPGVTRKTYRREELQALIDQADARHPKETP